MLNTLCINLFGFQVIIESNDQLVLSNLRKDFSLFLHHEDLKIEKILRLKILNDKPSFQSIPKIKPTFKRKRSVTIDDGNIRYNNYEDSLLSVFNFEKEEGEITSKDSSYLHEITYLLILSRSGKWLDLNGFHKIHACGFQYKDMNIILVMKMGQGKSTFFNELIKNESIKILSDDTPLVNNEGELLAFPLRIGLCPDIELGEDVESKHIYEINRKEYGKKTLIELSAFSNEIANKVTKQIVIFGERIEGKEIRITRKSNLVSLGFLFYHMIIGVGLPIIFEYFWQCGIKDFFVKTRIFFKRLFSAIKLTKKSQCFGMKFGSNPHYNAKELLHFLDKLN